MSHMSKSRNELLRDDSSDKRKADEHAIIMEYVSISNFAVSLGKYTIMFMTSHICREC